MKISKKTQPTKEVSTSSMPDIIFMLLIFFMVTTVLREFDGLPVLIPSAKMIEKLKSKRNTVYVWVTKDGAISINDIPIVGPTDLTDILSNVRLTKPNITVSLKSDQNASMELISAVHMQLRKANALKLSYSAKTKED